MPITRPSINLTAKANIRAVGNRLNEATAEDFVEIAAILIELIDKVDLFTGSATPNEFYGVWTSLALLQNNYTSAAAGAYANIDAGTGTDVQIALWDDTDNVWVLQLASTTISSKTIELNDEVNNVKVTDINGDPHIIVSGTYIGPDNTKLESYSANSYTRAL